MYSAAKLSNGGCNPVAKVDGGVADRRAMFHFFLFKRASPKGHTFKHEC